jgi:hypothetical protein
MAKDNKPSQGGTPKRVGGAGGNRSGQGLGRGKDGKGRPIKR